MQPSPSQPNLQPQGSNATATSSKAAAFIGTLEHRRFVEFCDACRRDRYIGLCFGPPGIGKTFSAQKYSRVKEIVPLDRWDVESSPDPLLDTMLYTPEVVNSPAQVESDVRRDREVLSNLATRAIRSEARSELNRLRLRDEQWRRDHRNDPDYRSSQLPPFTPTYFQAFEEYEARTKAIGDPTSLILVDEADRLHMNSIEQLRSIFDESGLGMVLIGMPGLEKKIARYPQFFSRIGFVHEFRPLAAADLKKLLTEDWHALGFGPRRTVPPPKVIAAIVRVTGGNFRLLTRLLTQMARVFTINELKELSPAVVETARENLVISQL